MNVEATVHWLNLFFFHWLNNEALDQNHTPNTECIISNCTTGFLNVYPKNWSASSWIISERTDSLIHCCSGSIFQCIIIMKAWKILISMLSSFHCIDVISIGLLHLFLRFYVVLNSITLLENEYCFNVLSVLHYFGNVWWR